MRPTFQPLADALEIALATADPDAVDALETLLEGWVETLTPVDVRMLTESELLVLGALVNATGRDDLRGVLARVD